jgi:hypothetical protein
MDPSGGVSEVDQFIVERLVEVGGALEGITSTFALDKNIVCVHTTSPCTLLSLATNWQERVYPPNYSGIDLCVPPHYFNPYFPELHWQESVGVHSAFLAGRIVKTV